MNGELSSLRIWGGGLSQAKEMVERPMDRTKLGVHGRPGSGWVVHGSGRQCGRRGRGGRARPRRASQATVKGWGFGLCDREPLEEFLVGA